MLYAIYRKVFYIRFGIKWEIGKIDIISEIIISPEASIC